MMTPQLTPHVARERQADLRRAADRERLAAPLLEGRENALFTLGRRLRGIVARRRPLAPQPKSGRVSTAS
jgi:hypothetical protein